jgi:hypothetical protein
MVRRFLIRYLVFLIILLLCIGAIWYLTDVSADSHSDAVLVHADTRSDENIICAQVESDGDVLVHADAEMDENGGGEECQKDQNRTGSENILGGVAAYER